MDKDVREENNSFYRKCLDYVLCIQEFEEKWFHFFAESVRNSIFILKWSFFLKYWTQKSFLILKIFAFIQSWTTFYHEGYERHVDYENKLSKSHGGIQALRNNFDYLKVKSSELIANILKVSTSLFLSLSYI